MNEFKIINRESHRRAVRRRENLQRKRAQCSRVFVLVLLIMIGFPGQWKNVLGASSETFFRNLAALLEVLLMLYTSGDNLKSLTLPALKKRYIPIYAILVVFLLTSVLGTNNLSGQLVKCIRFSLTILFAIWSIENYSLEELLEFLYQATVLYILACLLLFALHPSYVYNAEEGAFCWLQNAKNGGGMIAVELLSFQLMLLKIRMENGRKTSAFFYLILLAQIIMMIMTMTVSADILIIIVFVFLFFIYKRDAKKRNLGILYLLINFGLLTLAMTVLQLFAPVLELLGKDPTLTGRVTMWQHIIRFMLGSPHILTGYGLDNFWYTEDAVAALHSTYTKNSWFSMMNTGAHNTMLELWLNVGAIGVLTYCGCAARSLWYSADMEDHDYLFCMIFMLTLAIDGVIERGIALTDINTFYTFMVMVIGCKATETSKVKNKKAKKLVLYEKK